MFRTLILADHERGLRRRAGRVVRWLGPGRHTLWFGRAGSTFDERIDLSAGVVPYTPELAAVAPDGAFQTLEVGPREFAVVRRDGVAVRALGPGRYLLWQERERITASLHSVEPTFTDVPRAEWEVAPAWIRWVTVQPYERVVLFVDGAPAEVLEPGRHGLNRAGREQIDVRRVDLREQELVVAGQELMTRDKVSIRVSLTLRYRVVSPETTIGAVVDLSGALYTTVQLAARRRIAASTLDQLLEGRNEAGADLAAGVAELVSTWGVALTSLDLKDIVLPGAMKEILNQVLEAEKRAAANVILRREETAATRSLANTAKLMDQNPTLLRLKELETVERLAGQVGDLTVVASADQLLGTLHLR